jgi:uncharacterized CHY-type Zn-finger protein
MGEVIDLREYHSVRFFSEDVICGHCERETRGRVYDSGEAVRCTECGGPMIEIASAEFEGVTVVTFHSEDD